MNLIKRTIRSKTAPALLAGYLLFILIMVVALLFAYRQYHHLYETPAGFTRELSPTIIWILIFFVLISIVFGITAARLYKSLVKNYSVLKSTLYEKEAATQRASSVLNALPAFIALLNNSGFIIDVNEAWRKFESGEGFIGSEARVGDNYLQIVEKWRTIVGTDSKWIADGIRNAEVNKGFTAEYQCGSKVPRWYRLSVTPQGDHAGGVVLMHVDITHQKSAEEKIRLNDNHFRALVENAGDIISLTDENGMITYVSPALEKVTGYTLSEVKGRSFFDLMHPLQVSDARHSLEQMLDQPGVPIPCINRFIHKNGSYVWVEGMAINLLHDDNVKAIVSNYRDITQRREAEQSIKQSESNLKAIFDNTSEGFILTDTLCIVKLFNHKAHESVFMNMNGEIEIGGDLFDYVEESRRDFFEDAISRVLNGETVQYDRLYERRDGRKLWYNYSITPVTDEEIINGICITSRDITERKRAEEERAKSEIRFRTLMQNSTDGLTLVNTKGEVLEISPSGKRILGYSQDEMVGTIRPELVHPDDTARVREAFEMVIANPAQPVEIEYRFRRPDGKYNWLESTFHNQLHEDAVQAIVMNYRDVTEKKRSQELLVANEKRYRALVENGGDAVVILSPEGKPGYVSPSITRVVGYTEQEAMNLDMYTLTHPDDVKGVEEVMMQALASPGMPVAGYTGRLRHKNGSWRWFDATITNLLHDPAIGGIVDNFRDVTSRVEAERLLEEQNIQLKKTNAELDRFVYSTSHDLRSPLTSVLGLLTFIEEETHEDDTRHHAGMIRARINHLDQFIQSILNYSRNNRMEVATEAVQTRELVANTIESLRDMAEARGIQFEVDIEETAPLVTDRHRLQNVFENLISNAIKYHRKSGDDRFIKVSGTVDEFMLNIVVEDNGIGIAPVNQEKIFDMFYRVPGDVAGSGIGLYIVREILDKIDGKISIKSALNKGTSFILAIQNMKSK